MVNLKSWVIVIFVWIRTFLVKLYNTWKKNKTNKNKNPVSWYLAIIWHTCPILRHNEIPGHLTQMLHCFASKHAAVTWSRRPLNSMSLSILRFTRCSQRYNNKIKLSKNLPKCFSLMVTFYTRGSKLMLFSCRKFCYWWQNILFLIDRPENFLLFFLKTVYQYLFTFASIFILHKAS